jgi:hypothetical protein
MPGIDLPFGEAPAAPTAAAATPREALLVAAGWCMLAGVDLTLRVAGFHRFYRVVERWPLRRPPAAEKRAEVAERTCAAVDRARVYYVKRAWCLQRAAASVCLLRLRGIPAELVIGVRKIPFSAHAWTEVEGEVVNDPAGLRSMYAEMSRC